VRQVTLVMLYGPKPDGLSHLITGCQKQIVEIFGDRFEPYDMHQVHATLVSLRQVPGSAGANLNFERYRGKQAIMDFSGLLNFFRFGGHFPFQVQIGGFEKRDYPFTSQGQTPHERSFSLLGNEIAIALMAGWPVRKRPNGVEEKYPLLLDEMRRSFQKFNILHKYHAGVTDLDNDFYFRLGSICQPDSFLRERVESTVKRFLSEVKPVIIEINASDVYLASFQNETLLPSSTEVWSVGDSRVTPAFIRDLYKESPQSSLQA